jgi:uncharacterized NAD-dependent epimerase/dehydratase family protein
MLELARPYLIFLGDAQTEVSAKTGFGIRDWRPDDVLAQWRLPACTVDLGVPMLSPGEARAKGAHSLVIGVAPVGGAIPAAWAPTLIEAARAGLDIVSGMHHRLADVPGLADAARGSGVRLVDVRHSGRAFPAANGRKRSGMRLLTVGTDCALGKKYTALAIADRMSRRGGKATFRATGQTGIMISGAGVAIDAVVSDFVAGAAEVLSPDNTSDHWDVIEGQGALFHPAYAGVTLGLLHGSQPDALVLCHDPLRTEIESFPGFPIPRLPEAIARYVEAGRLTNPEVCFVGVSLNTSKLARQGREQVLSEIAEETGLPVFDPLVDGVDVVVDAMLAMQGERVRR